MNYLKVVFGIVKIVYLVLISLLTSCSENIDSLAKQPTLNDYMVGETWTWKYKGVTTEGEVRSEGEDTREIVSKKGVLGMTIGKDTIPLSDITKLEESKTPKYKH